MATNQHVPTLNRVFDSPMAKIWRCCDRPKLFAQWFCPDSWRVSDVKLDLRNAGRLPRVMNAANGEHRKHTGVFLDIPGEKRTAHANVFCQGWIPSGKAFMVVHISLEEVGGDKANCVTEAVYWSAETKAEHEKEGLYTNRNKAADRVEVLAKSLADNNLKPGQG